MKYSLKQVPLPLVIEFYDTWDVKISHGHVHVSQTGAGSDFFGSIKLCFHHRGIKPSIAFIFLGKRKGAKYS